MMKTKDVKLPTEQDFESMVMDFIKLTREYYIMLYDVEVRNSLERTNEDVRALKDKCDRLADRLIRKHKEEIKNVVQSRI